MRSAVKRRLTLIVGSGEPGSPDPPAGSEPRAEQLAFPIPAAKLTESVGLAGPRPVHAVPWMPGTAKRLGLDGWPLRAFCGVAVKDTAGGTTDPSAIGCRACLRAMRRAGLL